MGTEYLGGELDTPKITEMFAYIATDEGPDDEGIIAQKFGDVWMPLVGADMKRMDSLREVAKELGKVSGARIILAKFTKREDLGEV